MAMLPVILGGATVQSVREDVVRENVVVSPLYPALKLEAKLGRPSGASVVALCSTVASKF
jgi:hypothetical protein